MTNTDNPDALQFVLQYQPLAWKIARSFASTEADCEDLFQEICISLWTAHEVVPEDGNQLSFAYRVAFNRATSWHRKRKTYLDHLARFLRLVPRAEHYPLVDQECEELELLYEAIRQLSQPDRTLILLYLDRRSYAEMSAIIGTNESTVGKRLSRAKQRLAKLIAQEHEDES